MGSDLGIKQPSRMLTNVNIFLIAVILGLCLYISKSKTSISPDSTGCEVSFGSYKGSIYNNKASGTRGEPKCLVESKFLKVQQHEVKMPGTDFVINDWLWIDYHDRINVLVEAEAATTGQMEREFLIFEQSKYALEGRMSKAIIGGIIEPGETPEVAAAREIEEEMGLSCRNLHFLGRYRTDGKKISSIVSVTCTMCHPCFAAVFSTDHSWLPLDVFCS